jgi:hypothetical protein
MLKACLRPLHHSELMKMMGSLKKIPPRLGEPFSPRSCDIFIDRDFYIEQRSARFHSINKILIICTQKRNRRCKWEAVSMEIVKKTTLAYCDSTHLHLSTPRVQNTQNSRFADLWYSDIEQEKNSFGGSKIRI